MAEFISDDLPLLTEIPASKCHTHCNAKYFVHNTTTNTGHMLFLYLDFPLLRVILKSLRLTLWGMSCTPILSTTLTTTTNN